LTAREKIGLYEFAFRETGIRFHNLTAIRKAEIRRLYFGKRQGVEKRRITSERSDAISG